MTTRITLLGLSSMRVSSYVGDSARGAEPPSPYRCTTLVFTDARGSETEVVIHTMGRDCGPIAPLADGFEKICSDYDDEMASRSD